VPAGAARLSESPIYLTGATVDAVVQSLAR
jgi:hypothetical protein